MSPEIALRNQVSALLLASPALAELVGQKVFDDVPSGEDANLLPWLCFGPINVQRVEMGGAPAWGVKLRVFAESGASDRDEVWAIARAAIRAVDLQEPPADAGFCDRLVVGQAGDVLDPGSIKSVFFDVSCILIDVA